MATPSEVPRPNLAPRPVPPKFGAKLPAVPPPAVLQNPAAGAGPASLVSPRAAAASVAGRPSFKLAIEPEAPIDILIDPRKPVKALIEPKLTGRAGISFKTHVVRDSNGTLLDVSKPITELNVFEMVMVPGDEADLAQAAALYSLEPVPRPPAQSGSDSAASNNHTDNGGSGVAGGPPGRPIPGGPRPPGPVHNRVSSAPGLINPLSPGARPAPPVASGAGGDVGPAKRPPSSEIPTTNTPPPAANSPGTPKRTVIPPPNRPLSASLPPPNSIEGRIIAAEERMALLEESMTHNSKLLEQIMGLLQIKQ